MYPRDAITLSFSTKTPGTYTLLPSSTTPYTLLSGTVSGTGAGGDEQAFILGTSSIWVKGDLMQQSTMHLVYANIPLRVVKVGNATTTFGITYVPRNRNTTPDPDPFVQATSTYISNWQFSTSTMNVICLSGCSSSSTLTLGSSTITLQPSTSTYMDSSTTELYQSNLHMQNSVLSIALYALVIYSVYWLIRKLF